MGKEKKVPQVDSLEERKGKTIDIRCSVKMGRKDAVFYRLIFTQMKMGRGMLGHWSSPIPWGRIGQKTLQEALPPREKQ